MTVKIQLHAFPALVSGKESSITYKIVWVEVAVRRKLFTTIGDRIPVGRAVLSYF
jgi:hypothetical protein